MHADALRADALLDKGDVDGYAVLKRVVKAAEEFLSKSRFALTTPAQALRIGGSMWLLLLWTRLDL